MRTRARIIITAAASAAISQNGTAANLSAGSYRLPYADGVAVRVFDDVLTHRPAGRTDLFAVDAGRPVQVVAADDGIIMAIQDGFAEQQSGRPAKECRNNYVWIAHRNGEWTNYSHVAKASVRKAAGLRVGDRVRAGQMIGYEAAVGCAMLDHVHFEVAVPGDPAIDVGGFLIDNEDGHRERVPRFCGVAGDLVRKGATYTATPCAPD